jgi:hypothetical protein
MKTPNISYTSNSRDRLVVRTPRCGRGNPGSNPGLGRNRYPVSVSVEDYIFFKLCSPLINVVVGGIALNGWVGYRSVAITAHPLHIRPTRRRPSLTLTTVEV